MAESFPQTALPAVVAPKMKVRNTASPRPRAQSGNATCADTSELRQHHGP